MPTREATVINRANGNPFYDIDPVEIEVTTDRDVAIGDHPTLVDLLVNLINIELDGDNNTAEDLASGNLLSLSLVWSDTMNTEPVRGLCPICDDVFRVDDDGAPEEMPDGSMAVVCSDCLD